MNINYVFSASHKYMYGRKETVNVERNPITGICLYSRVKMVDTIFSRKNLVTFTIFSTLEPHIVIILVLYSRENLSVKIHSHFGWSAHKNFLNINSISVLLSLEFDVARSTICLHLKVNRCLGWVAEEKGVMIIWVWSMKVLEVGIHNFKANC